MMIIDDFLTTFDSLRTYADTAMYVDEVNPEDGVTYPLICRNIPSPIRDEVLQRLALQLGRPLQQSVMFLRQSPKGVATPQQVHSDEMMGNYSLMLYLNREEHCQGGTAFVRHKATGMAFAPESDEGKLVLIRDSAIPEAWSLLETAWMAPNRALIFESHRIHRAEPVGGFGASNQDARVVLTCFFS